MGFQHFTFAINPVQTALDRWFQSLSASYPALSWMVGHPILAVISLLILLAIIQILLGWISSGIKHLLFTIFKSPYSLVRWLLGKTAAPLTPPKTKSNKWSKSKSTEHVSTLLKRLNHHHREQEKLILELTTLIAHNSSDTPLLEDSLDNSTSSSDSNSSKISSS